MSGPRNRKAYRKSIREREMVRQALLEHARLHPLSKPPTAAELRRLTGIRVSDRRLQQHALSIRTEAEIRELIEDQFDRSAPSAVSPSP